MVCGLVYRIVAVVVNNSVKQISVILKLETVFCVFFVNFKVFLYVNRAHVFCERLKLDFCVKLRRVLNRWS